jgi:hypothetical protein
MISCIVFAGRITEIGKPYKYDVFGTPYKTPLVANGMIMALDEQTVGSPVGVGGPSAGNGMLSIVSRIMSIFLCVRVHCHLVSKK